jgi:hypothetical protein
MNKTITHRNDDKRVGQTLRAIVPQIKIKLKKMEKIAELATTSIRREIGRDLITARTLCDKTKVSFTKWLDNNFAMHQATAFRYISLAESPRSREYTSITEHLRAENPNYALPRQRVDDIDFEPAGKKILSGISTGIFVERTLTESKEKALKKKMALELVDAGYRAISIKAHSDKGGSDEVMRRLTEVRDTLKDAIQDDDIYF